MGCVSKKEYSEICSELADKVRVFKTSEQIRFWIRPRLGAIGTTYADWGKEILEYISWEVSRALGTFLDRVGLPIPLQDFLEFYPNDGPWTEAKFRECEGQERFDEIVIGYCEELGNRLSEKILICDFWLVSIAKSVKCRPFRDTLKRLYFSLADEYVPFDERGLMDFRANVTGRRDINGVPNSVVEEAYAKLRKPLIDAVLFAAEVASQAVGSNLSYLPPALDEFELSKYLEKTEREKYCRCEELSEGMRGYNIFYTLPEYVNKMGQDRFKRVAGHILAFLDCVMAAKRQIGSGYPKSPKPVPKAPERKRQPTGAPKTQSESRKTPARTGEKAGRTLLVFDFDGTVFDTDHLRTDRRKRSVDESKLAGVDYVEGFREMFLDDPGSPLFLGNFKVLGITSSYSSYHRELLRTHQDFTRRLSYPVIRTGEKISELKKFLAGHRGEFDKVLAFGDDEKDALIYSLLGDSGVEFNYYIVNKHYGYDAKVGEIVAQVKANASHPFRKGYLHDVKPLAHTAYDIRQFDDIVLYYKNYLDTHRFDEWEGREKGSNYAPPVNGVKPLRIYKARNELGKSSKNTYILGHLGEIASIFDDLPIGKGSLLVCVPGHAETAVDREKPMFKLISEIARRHEAPSGTAVGILCRKYETDESKDGNRGIDKHLESIKITEEGKRCIKGKTVFLFDDIATSGSSMMACSAILYAAGAGHVICLCVARTCGDGDYAPTEVK